MRGCRLYLVIVFLLFQVSISAHRRYQYACLERIATSLQLSSEFNTLEDGTYFYTYHNKPIKVYIDKGRIHHIGFALFPATDYKQSFSVIYDFIERYLLELHLNIGKEKDINSRIKQDGVIFDKGNFGVMLSFVGKENLSVLLEELDGKTYRITLSADQDICVLAFPVEYNLLHSTDMLETEKNIADDLKDAAESLLITEYPDTSILVSLPNGLSVYWRENIYTENLSSNHYFTLFQKKVLPVYSKKYIKESLANLLAGLIPDNRYRIRIKLIKYNYQSEELYISLNQLIRYCQDNNCQSFFGLIDVKNDIAECEWIMKNKEEGYSHVMHVYIPLDNWEQKTGEIKARLNSFIPMSKIKNLYEEINK